MSDSPRPDAARSPGGPPNPMRRLDDLVGRARLVLWWERIWPALWGPLAVALMFVAASWAGLLLGLAPPGGGVVARSAADGAHGRRRCVRPRASRQLLAVRAAAPAEPRRGPRPARPRL